MEDNKDKIKYIIYVRKSSDSEDRQVLSIESQVNELNRLAKSLNLNVIETITESKSAKAPGRLGFTEMMEMINLGKANGILCWKLDRLARNAIDGGSVIWMLQEGKIKHIQTPSKEYKPEDNTLLMHVEFGMANQFVRDLSINVKRGLKTRLEKGWYPGLAKPGYLNDKYCDQGERKIIIDKDRFPLIRKAFDELLTGLYRPSEVLNKLNNDWGFRTFKRKRSGCKPMSKSIFYKMITDSFYCGRYEFPKNSGKWYQGKHKAVITEAEFSQLQKILGNDNKPTIRPQKYVSPFTGLIKCACGSAITIDIKHQTICTNCKHKFSSRHVTACTKCNTEISAMTNPTQTEYEYYRCTKAKNSNCKEKCVEVKQLKNK